MRIIALVIALAMVGCAGQFPECNQKYDQNAIVVRVAMEEGVCLRDVGSTLILANGINISAAKLYTARQALSAVDTLITALEQPIINGDHLIDLVYESISGFPELIIVTDMFYGAFDIDEPIDKSSKAILIDYLRERVRPMLVARIAIE